MADINSTQLRDALAWATNDKTKAEEPSTNPFVWFWEAIEGDFNEGRSTAQILVDAGISMIPLVDQVCDVRDLVANCRKILRDYKDTWAWVALVLTLIGLFPSLGSLVKGVLKIFFGFLRNAGGRKMAQVVDDAMSWVITFLRRRDVQKYLKLHKVDQVFKWLATEVKALRGKINVGALTAAFDRAIKVLESLAGKVEFIPSAGAKAKKALEEVRRIRLVANDYLGAAIKPAQEFLDTVILRLEREALVAQNGIVDVANVHFRGALPEAAAIALIRDRKPSWLSNAGGKKFRPLKSEDERGWVDDACNRLDVHGTPRPADEVFPHLSDQSIESFHTLVTHVIHGPARLYRVLAPSSRAMSDCWVTKEVFDQLQSAPNPKDAWRKHLAVWPDWNVNGQFVIYDVKAGESLNTWRGAASSQTKKGLPGHHLEGGWEQIVFNIERADHRNDTMLYYQLEHGKVPKLGQPLSQAEVNAMRATMSDAQKAAFDESLIGLRHTINHPNISGPFETGWGYSEFDGAGLASRIGLPSLPGQITTTR